MQARQGGRKIQYFFLNLEKVRGYQGKVRKLIVSNHEITEIIEIIEREIVFFYKSFFKNIIKKTLSKQTNF